MAHLSFFKNGEHLLKFILTKNEIKVGRNIENDICLSDKDISRLHFILIKQDNKYHLIDKSTNGTYVNDKKVISHQLLDKDEISTGRWLIIFELEDVDVQTNKTILLDYEPTRFIEFSKNDNSITLEKYSMMVLTDESQINKFFENPVISIGKGEDNDITIPDEFISANHCKIEFTNNEFLLTDLNSTNGTMVNSKKVLTSKIDESSVITIGKSELKLVKSKKNFLIKPYPDNYFEGIISSNKKMRELFSQLELVAKTNTPVLITGESGTGKELVSKAIHRRSLRCDKIFLPVNCAAMSKDLIESELFGHEKGAFTSAIQSRKGAFEYANGGTLFLDEIGELHLDLQSKLLRVLENHEIKRVGSNEIININTRLITATNQNLFELISNGNFREDLFYRLEVMTIKLLPLRERKEDIPHLAEHFIRIANPTFNDKTKINLMITKSAIAKLMDYSWPGNIRELRNVINRAIVFAQEKIIEEQMIIFSLPEDDKSTYFEFKKNKLSSGKPKTLQEIERKTILDTLKSNDWSRKESAKALGIAVSTLHDKIKKYDLKP